MIRLETNRLILHNDTMDSELEYQFFLESFSDEEYEQELLFNNGLINSELGKYFAIFKVISKEYDSFIGYCKLLPRYFTSNETWIINTQGDRAKWPSSLNVEISWKIFKDYQNEGFATEASKAIIDYAFNTLNLGKVVAVTDINNIPSMKIMESLKMQIKIAPNSSLAYGVVYNDKY